MNPPLHFHYVITYVHNTLRAAAAAATLFARMKREISSSFVVPIKFYLMMMTIRPLQQGMRFFPNGRQFLLWGVGCFPPSASLSLWSCLLRIDINELLKLQRSSRLDTHTGQIIYQLLYHYENILYFLRPKCFMIFEILNGKRVNLYKMTKCYTNSK